GAAPARTLVVARVVAPGRPGSRQPGPRAPDGPETAGHRGRRRSVPEAGFRSGAALRAQKNPRPGRVPATLLDHLDHSMVAGEGIEPPTRGFSIPCSTN